MHDSSTCEICRGLPIDGSLTDEQFAGFLDACRREMAGKQQTFQQRIEGASRWRYEMVEGTLTVGDTVFGMTPIGTFSEEHKSWLWAWANPDFPPSARQAASGIQSLHAITGFKVFLNEGTTASAVDAQDLVAFAVHALSASGFFRCPSDGPTLYLAVHGPIRT
jgi:hypothetical protein